VEEYKVLTVLMAITMVIGLFLAFWVSTNKEETFNLNATANCTCNELECDCKLDFNDERGIPKRVICSPADE
jgi:hypothetical protein